MAQTIPQITMDNVGKTLTDAGEVIRNLDLGVRRNSKLALLYTVSAEHSVLQKDIADKFGWQAPDVSVIRDTLSKKGLINVHTNESNRRQLIWTLTDAAEVIGTQIDAQLGKPENPLTLREYMGLIAPLTYLAANSQLKKTFGDYAHSEIPARMPNHRQKIPSIERMVYVRESPGINCRVLAKKSDVEEAAISLWSLNMEKLKLLSVRHYKRDLRSVHYTLTDHGKAYLKAVFGVAVNSFNELRDK